MLVLAILLAFQIGIDPQVSEVDVLPKGDNKAGTVESELFTIKDWPVIAFEPTNDPAEWQALAGLIITFSIQCSKDGGRTFYYRVPPNTFRGGTLGPKGDGLPRYIGGNKKDELCKVEVTTDKDAAIGIKVTSSPATLEKK